ncbi:MAG: glycosyltransferase family 4 protein [Pseudomonadota bacterium]
MRILHISADYPDPLVAAKTRAVSNLLAMAAEAHEHRVISLNRIGPGAGVRALDFADAAGGGHRAVAYGAPAKGVMLRRYLEQLADWIAADCAAAGFAPEAVHAHKLTVEGIVGQRLAEAWDVPLIVSVQGNTDLKIVRAKRGMRPLYADIWANAAVAFPFAPWARAGLDELLAVREGPTHFLPCPGPADARLAPEVCQGPPVIATALNMRDAENKNIARLIRATAKAAREVPDIRLDVIGGGDAAAFARLASLAEAEAPGRVRFLGAVPHGEVQRLFHAAAAFALVSHRESYGMVFAEALLAGAPCLIPRGQGIDGYFEEGSVVLSAPSRNEGAMASALVRLAREEAAFKTRLADLGGAGGLDFMTRDAIAATYLDALAAI